MMLIAWAMQIDLAAFSGAKRKRQTQEDGPDEEEGGPLYHYKPWLGFWKTPFNDVKSTTELVLQATLSTSYEQFNPAFLFMTNKLLVSP